LDAVSYLLPFLIFGGFVFVMWRFGWRRVLRRFEPAGGRQIRASHKAMKGRPYKWEQKDDESTST
jgi:hypothetical protein